MLSFVKKYGIHYVALSNLTLKGIGFLYLILLARILSKSEMGIVAYAESILRFAYPFFSAGLFYAVLVYGSRQEVSLNSLLRQVFAISIHVNIVCFIIIGFFLSFYDFAFKGIDYIIAIVLLSGVVKSYLEILYSGIRSQGKVKLYSILSVLNTAILLSFVCLLSVFFGINGYLTGLVLTPLIMLVLAFFKGNFSFLNIIKSEKSRLSSIDVFYKSFVTGITNLFSSLVYSSDIFLIGMILKSSEITSSYHIATLIPNNLSFLSLAIMIALFPHVSSSHKEKSKLKKQYSKVLYFSFLFAVSIAMVLYFLSEWIVPYLFGSQYADSVVFFEVLLIGFIFGSSFRVISGNYLSALGHVKINLYMAVGFGTINVIGNYIFINEYGAMGAAYTTVLTMLLTGLCGHYYLLKKLES